ncbi:MAG: phosphoribosylamine--glycine ligase, partial [Actinomycetota bacterium]|nr:phosphoribosylamine--glycine ligase [Actinomycetota bacterium]
LATAEPPRWRGGAAVTVVVAAPGYPQHPRIGDAVRGVDAAEALDGVHVVHAGTERRAGGLISAGGRVLSVVGVGLDVAAARARAYAGVERINLTGSHHRTDVAAPHPADPLR